MLTKDKDKLIKLRRTKARKQKEELRLTGSLGGQSTISETYPEYDSDLGFGTLESAKLNLEEKIKPWDNWDNKEEDISPEFILKDKH